MKKKFFVALIAISLVMLSVLQCYATEPVESIDETNKGSITSWGMLEDDGFFVDSDKQSPYYGWLYAPDGKLLIEGYLDMYSYYPSKGYASIAFRTASGLKSYYSHPSNLIMEWRNP